MAHHPIEVNAAEALVSDGAFLETHYFVNTCVDIEGNSAANIRQLQENFLVSIRKSPPNPRVKFHRHVQHDCDRNEHEPPFVDEVPEG